MTPETVHCTPTDRSCESDIREGIKIRFTIPSSATPSLSLLLIPMPIPCLALLRMKQLKKGGGRSP